ncbi:MAG TPA: hypothetical protein VGE32_11665 [Cellvibrio sp.]
MNTEEAYQAIAQEAIEEAGDSLWDSVVVEAKIFEKASKVTHWIIFKGKKSQGNGDASSAAWGMASKGRLFLRDNLLETTGERIWGFTFTLTRDGNFNIEYDYEKPEGFDD